MAFTVVDHFTTLLVFLVGLFHSIKEEYSTMSKRITLRSIEEWREFVAKEGLFRPSTLYKRET